MLNSNVISAEPEKNLIGQIFENFLGTAEFCSAPITNRGMENRVYKFTSDGKSYVIRMNNSEYAEEMFSKESWCIDVTRSLAIPTPRILHSGKTKGWVYAIYNFIESSSVIKNQRDLWYRLGDYAKRINSIETMGIGVTLLDRKNREFSVSWKEWVEGELNKIADDQKLVTEKILTKTEKSRALDILEGFYDWKFSPRLCHGDLSLDNVVVGDEIYLLDWGNAISHRAPHYDLAEISLWNSDSRVIEEFCRGYGAESSVLEEEVELIAFWRALWAARRDVTHFKDWRSSRFIERSIAKIKQRLAIC